MDRALSSLHKLQKDCSWRKANRPLQGMRKPYLCRNWGLLQLSQTSFCNWGFSLTHSLTVLLYLELELESEFYIHRSANDTFKFQMQIDKAYPRDFMQRGRVRVLLKKEDGTLHNPSISSSKIYTFIAFLIIINFQSFLAIHHFVLLLFLCKSNSPQYSMDWTLTAFINHVFLR